MIDDRIVKMTIGGEEYELLLTTKATKEIAKRYGGLSDLGDKLMRSEHLEDSIDEVMWLLALLINQAIMRYNLKNKDKPKDLITEDDLELLTTPADMVDFRASISEALVKGTKRNIESEEDLKNVQVE